MSAMQDATVQKERSMVLQKELVGNYYESLGRARATGQRVVSTFVPGNLTELLRSFDLLLGLRWFTADVPQNGNPIENIAHAYLAHSVSTASCYAPDGQRGQWLVDSVRRNRADGVIFCAPSFCDPALLEQPMLVAALEREHIPHTQFKYSEDTGQFAVIREQAGTFSDSIRLWSEA